jgi:hypothetical protein
MRGGTEMTTVRLFWKERVSKKKRAEMVRWIRTFYPKASDQGSYVQLRAVNQDTKFIWIFMLARTFRDLE